MKVRVSLTQCILSGLVLGVILGIVRPETAGYLSFLSQAFIRLLQIVVGPLVFSTLVVGIGSHGGAVSLKRLATGTIVFFLLGTTIAGIIGVLAANWFAPGYRVGVPVGALSPATPLQMGRSPSFLETLIPASFVEAMSSNNILGIVFFSVLFGVGLRAVGPAGSLVLDGCAALAKIMQRLTGYVMWCAPLGVFGAAVVTASRYGAGGLRPFLNLLIATYASLLLFILVFFVAVCVRQRISLLHFFHSMGDVLLLAFSTASSAATFPIALDRLQRWGASQRVTAFVLPLGYSFNFTGTCVYLPLATLFWAQFNGITFSWKQQILILGYALLIVRGLPPVARGLFFVYGAILAQFHLPPEGVMILLGVDPLFDMARTTVNVAGNCLAVVALDRWERPIETREAQEVSR